MPFEPPFGILKATGCNEAFSVQIQTGSISVKSAPVVAGAVKQAAREKNMPRNVNPDPDPTRRARPTSPEIVFEGNCRHPQYQMDSVYNLRNNPHGPVIDRKLHEKPKDRSCPKLKSISKCPSWSPSGPPKNLAHHRQPKSANVPPVVGGIPNQRKDANKDTLSGKSGAGAGSGSSSIVKTTDMSIVLWQEFRWPPIMGAGPAGAAGSSRQELPPGPTNVLDLGPNLLPSMLKVDYNQEPIRTTPTTTDRHDDDESGESVNKQIMARAREESVRKHRKKQKLQKQGSPVPVPVAVEQQEFKIKGTATVVAGEDSGSDSSQDLDVLELYPSDDEFESRFFGTIRLLS